MKKKKVMILAIVAVMITVVFTTCDNHTCDECDLPHHCEHIAGAAATCLTAQTCNACGVTLVAAFGHDWEQDGTAIIEATCLEDGEGEFHCARTGCDVTDDHHVIDALGHDHTSSLVCKNTPCDHQYAVGDIGPGGGIIYYVDPVGFDFYTSTDDTKVTAYYLEAAPANATGGTSPYSSTEMRWPTAASSPFATITGLEDIPTTNIGTGTSYSTAQIEALRAEIGKGRKNTSLIVASDIGDYDHAAKACSKYTTVTTTAGDWFLPSIGELYFLYASEDNEGNKVGSVILTRSYWSSSQGNSDRAWAVFFENGQRFIDFKEASYPVRAIRAF